MRASNARLRTTTRFAFGAWRNTLSVQILHGDCRTVLAEMPEQSVDTIVTDPPYELGFMGRTWDGTGVAFRVETWREALRVLKPGGHLAAFGGTRTSHRMICAIEDAGFEIRDSVMWIYGQGFPKSLDVSKAIDREAGVVRKVVGHQRLRGTARIKGGSGYTVETSAENYKTAELRDFVPITAPTTPEAAQWSGFGTALKPAHEPICLARKTLAKGCTVAANVLTHGTGALNIDAGWVPGSDKTPAPVGQYGGSSIGPDGHSGIRNGNADSLGRWPANVIHDGSEEVETAFAVFGERPTCRAYGDIGTASRFFYCAKASKSDRAGSKHPTVKPLSLMRWLCTLITPPGGIILDPFAGSGSTLQAAKECGFRAIGIEIEESYVADIHERMRRTNEAAGLFA